MNKFAPAVSPPARRTIRRSDSESRCITVSGHSGVLSGTASASSAPAPWKRRMTSPGAGCSFAAGRSTVSAWHQRATMAAVGRCA